jgi:molybdenum-dependent DNA-binding transcriptional regulator ModE
MNKIDPKLLDWATEREKEYVAALDKHGSLAKAAKAMGVAKSAVFGSIDALKKRAAKAGYSPEHDLVHPVAPGQMLKGTSTLYKDGQPVMQWVKTNADMEAMEEILKEFAQSLADSVKGLAPIVKPPKHGDDDILCVYPMGDPHFGMHAWWQDAGDDFDLGIAERLTCGAVDRLVASAPNAGTALLLNLGDMFHADNQKNQSQSGHQLDVDGRWAKVQQVGLRATIYCIQRLLEKHQRVIVRINRGNHDGHSSYALSLMLSCFFHNEPRVEVDLSPAVAWYYQFGQVLIGSTHGDTLKGQDLVQIMAADKPKEWGETRHRYWYVGHVHHQDSKEYRGGIVEYFRTLAARDAWHAGQGYRAGRDMRLIVIHRRHGEVERHRCDVAMID